MYIHKQNDHIWIIHIIGSLGISYQYKFLIQIDRYYTKNKRSKHG